MEIELLTFGKITELVPQQRISLVGTMDTDLLQQQLEKINPALAKVKYKLAVNKIVVQQNTLLREGDTVAIMPPFSGG